jgi:hypothetical protein
MHDTTTTTTTMTMTMTMMMMMMTRTKTTTPNRTTSASRRSSENPTKTNKREGSCNSSPALISVRFDDWLR